jgi:pimeloyl-ACP methyl ester carboxylesterase
MSKPAKVAAITLLAQVMASAAPGVDFVRSQIATNEGHVSYEVRKRFGPPLILIPGSFNCSDQWKAAVQGLDRDLTLVLVEVRGHGQSWPPPANGSIEQFAQDVLRIADAEKIERFYVGGHSIGGMIALEIGRVSPRRILGILSLEGWTHHQAHANAFPNENKYQRRPEHERQRLAERESGAGKRSDEQRKAFATIWRKWDGREFLVSTSIPILEL